MTNKPPDSFKELCLQVSNYLFNIGKNTVGDFLSKYDLSEHASRTKSMRHQEQNTKSAKSQKVGIWKYIFDGTRTYFERDIAMQNEWPLWAKVHRIYEKENKRRVVFLGESVARGYFYDPFYSVSSELSAILRDSLFLQEFEIVDLARTSLTLEELEKLLEECLLLNPDFVVIFAGNNWFTKLSDSLSDTDYQNLYNLYLSNGYQGVKGYLDAIFKNIICSFLSRLHALFIQRGLPVVFVIPEFNLLDWKSDKIEKANSWLSNDLLSAWAEAERQVLSASRRDCLDDIKKYATALVEIDPSNPWGYETLAESLIKENNFIEARRLLELGRDTAIFRKSKISNPRCFSLIRTTVLDVSKQLGIEIVDLPKLLSVHSRNGIPDRHLFLDYCHLNVDGIKHVSREIARKLFEIYRGKSLDLKEIPPSVITPSDKVQSIAHLCAAIHNAHYGQNKEIIDFHINRAIQFSSIVKDIMINCIDFFTRRTSTVFCDSFVKLIENGNIKQYEGGLGIPHPKGLKLLDVKLVDCMASFLEHDRPSIREEILKLRKIEHGLEDKEINLLESYYKLSSYNRFVVDELIYEGLRFSDNRFLFVGDKRSIEISIVYKTPEVDSVRNLFLTISVNNKDNVIRKLPYTNHWSLVSFPIYEENISDGVNELIIVCPYVHRRYESERYVTKDLFLNSVFPSMAEVSKLTIKRL